MTLVDAIDTMLDFVFHKSKKWDPEHLKDACIELAEMSRALGGRWSKKRVLNTYLEAQGKKPE